MKVPRFSKPNAIMTCLLFLGVVLCYRNNHLMVGLALFVMACLFLLMTIVFVPASRADVLKVLTDSKDKHVTGLEIRSALRKEYTLPLGEFQDFSGVYDHLRALEDEGKVESRLRVHSPGSIAAQRGLRQTEYKLIV